MTGFTPLPPLLPLTPQYQERVWGGQNLKPSQSGTPIGEAWVAYGQSVVAAGPAAGQTVDALMHAGQRAALLGSLGSTADEGFPLLIKLLDCADWLSVQVHPNDEQARQMVGPGERGKTEAWHLLRATPDAQLLAGVRQGTSQDALAAAIRDGHVLDVAERHAVGVGDTVAIPAGTLHALGPGLLLYEVQESSDTTYRVYDWDRPASAGRALHLEQSVAVTRADLRGEVRPATETHGEGRLTRNEYFVLSGVRLGAGEVSAQDTAGRSFAVLTVTEGQVEVTCQGAQVQLDTFETALVTGEAGKYTLQAKGGDAKVLISTLPEE